MLLLLGGTGATPITATIAFTLSSFTLASSATTTDPPTYRTARREYIWTHGIDAVQTGVIT